MDSVLTAPGPTRHLPGTFLFRMRRNPLAFMVQMAKQYGDVVHFQVGSQHFFLLNHPDYIKEVLVTQDRSFMKGEALQRTKRLLGEGLLTSEGDFHRRQRRIIQPIFNHSRLQGYGEVMSQCVARITDRWRTGDVFDISAEMNRLALMITGNILFGMDVDNVAGDVRESLNAIVNIFSIMLLPFSDFLEYLPLPGFVRARRAQKNLDTILFRIIEDARTRQEDSTLISLLLNARDEDGSGMSDQQIRDEAMTLFLAGHETTANALSWTWHLLAQHPNVEEKLCAELDTVLGGRMPLAEDMDRLPYSSMVLMESMRLYPPAWVIGRRALEDVVIGSYFIPADSIVAVSPYIAHHDPRFYHDPERFDPERWTREERAQRPAYSYLPFGGGSRLCIGKNLAMMEGILLLAAIAQQWTLRIVPGQRVKMQPAITLRMKNGLRVVLHHRGTESQSRM